MTTETLAIRGLLAAILSTAFGLAMPADCDKCGPTYCTGTNEAQKALAAKKKAAEKNAYPKRLVDLYNKLDQCEACITGAPDGFSLFRVDTKRSIAVSSWDKDNEAVGANDLTAGKLTHCFVVLQRRACECCGSLPYTKRPDYAKELDLSRSLATPCQK